MPPANIGLPVTQACAFKSPWPRRNTTEETSINLWQYISLTAYNLCDLAWCNPYLSMWSRLSTAMQVWAHQNDHWTLSDYNSALDWGPTQPMATLQPCMPPCHIGLPVTHEAALYPPNLNQKGVEHVLELSAQQSYKFVRFVQTNALSVIRISLSFLAIYTSVHLPRKKVCLPRSNLVLQTSVAFWPTWYMKYNAHLVIFNNTFPSKLCTFLSLQTSSL